MVYNPVTDFFALWRNGGGQVTKVEMPGLDLVAAALARAGFITLSVSATAPVVNQSTTAWLQAAVPSNSAEGVMRLWNPVTAAYVAATPTLLFTMLQTSAGRNGVSIWFSVGGPPLNTVGLDGDIAIRTDEPGGIYGPKVAGAWPGTPIPGTTDVIGSTQLDQTFGTVQGTLVARGAAVWQALLPGPANSVMYLNGADPAWETLSALMDAVFGSAQGSILFRDAGLWNDLPPGTAGQILSTNGAGANPAWAARTAEFPSGTAMLFQQSAAPTGWTKQTLLNDYGLRVTSGAAGSTAGSAFSTVFAQTAVGSTTTTIAQMPAHDHTEVQPGGVPVGLQGGGTYPTVNISTVGANTGSKGGGGSHNHSVNLTLAYVDVIIAVKN